MSSENSKVLCHFFTSPGGCWFGDRCRFSHIQNTSKSTDHRPFCTYFMSGKCRFGSSCFNRHAPVEYEMKTQDLSDIDTSLSNTPTSDSDQSEASAASASYVQVTQTTTEADTSRSSEECVKPRNKPSDLTCGQCDMHYEGTGAYDKLKEHYLDKLQRMDGKHTAFLSKGKFDKFSVCMECDDDRQFSNAHALLQHIVAKAKVVCKSQREHFNDLDCIAQMFVDRDAGNDTEKDFISFLCDYLTALGDESDDAFEGLYKDDINLISKDFDLMKPFAGKSETYCDSDDDGIFGFSEDDVFELMCQGIKPWDPEAGAALAILNGDDW